MRRIATSVESLVLRRLKFLKRLQDVQLSPEAGLEQLQRVETNSDSAEDRAIVITVMRATQAAQQLVEASPLPPQPAPECKAKRKRQLRRLHVAVTGVRACGGRFILLVVIVGRAIDECQRRLGLSLPWCRTRGGACRSHRHASR
jgi:hypothetical protein